MIPIIEETNVSNIGQHKRNSIDIIYPHDIYDPEVICEIEDEDNTDDISDTMDTDSFDDENDTSSNTIDVTKNKISSYNTIDI